MQKLADMCRNAVSRRPLDGAEIVYIWDSPEYAQANGLEQLLANSVLGTAYIRWELNKIVKRLEKIEEKISLIH